VLLLALPLAGCNTTGPQAAASVTATRGATVAFDSIDGPPRPVFDTLVQDLNAEVQSRHLAIVSRDNSSAYRVRGYLVAEGAPDRSTFNWTWDVYDGRRQRVLRISGEQSIKGKHRDAWAALDRPAVQKIARDSMDQLARFLTSPDAAPPPTQAAYSGESSPEAAGIFRIVPVSAESPADAAAVEPEQPADVPLPPRRPRAKPAGTVALAIPAID
jgi:hypothetical protein